MNFFMHILGVVVAIHSVIKVDGLVVPDHDNSDNENNYELMQEGEVPWLPMAKRNDMILMAARELEYTEDDYLLKPIMAILDNNIKEDLIRILTSLTKDQRDMVAIILSGLAWKTTKGCPRLSQAMITPRRITLKIMYPVAKLLYDDNVLTKVSKSDQQILKLVEQKVTANAQLLCK